MDEFEDAMKGTFHEFISHFPIIEVREDSRVAGGHTFRVRRQLCTTTLHSCTNRPCM